MKKGFACAFLALVVVACASSNQIPAQAPTSTGVTDSLEEQNMILSEQDSGRTVEIGVGEVVTVRLKENPGTGYRWSVDATDGLDLIGDRSEVGGAIGAAGVREFQFRPTKVGSYELHIKNWREWEGESSVVGRFNVRFSVK